MPVRSAFQPPFQLKADDRAATFGSSFARNISPMLRAAGFDFLLTETPAPTTTTSFDHSHNSGIYSACYGDIKTPRQIMQLFKRAYQKFVPDDDFWIIDGSYIDPFRPHIKPCGFLSSAAYQSEREQHFAAVRNAFERATVFIIEFETISGWCAITDNAMIPIAPEYVGNFSEQHKYHEIEMRLTDIRDDLEDFIADLRGINPGCKIIFLVSPLPAPESPFDRREYFKSVLVIALTEISRVHQNISYFPFYDIIQNQYVANESYLSADQTSINAMGWRCVMDCFFQSFTRAAPPLLPVSFSDDISP